MGVAVLVVVQVGHVVSNTWLVLWAWLIECLLSYVCLCLCSVQSKLLVFLFSLSFDVVVVSSLNSCRLFPYCQLSCSLQNSFICVNHTSSLCLVFFVRTVKCLCLQVLAKTR